MGNSNELIHYGILTNKQLETHRCILNTVANDTLVLKPQVISTHSAY